MPKLGMRNTTLLIYFLCTHESVANTTYVYVLVYISIYAWMDMQENAIYVHISIFKNRVLLNPKGMPHSQFTHLATIEKSSVSSNSWLVLHIHQQENFRTNWFNEPNRTPPIHHWSISKKNIAGLCRPSVHQKKILHHHFGEFFGQRKKNNNNL